MQIPLKILLVRFSSIGDIVLTTPVVRCLKKQLNAELHYLTKTIYTSILSENIYLDKVYVIKDHIDEIMASLKKERYDYVIDLHNNLRSNILTFKLGVKTQRYFKSNFKKFLLTAFRINILGESNVIERYMRTVISLGVRDDNQGLDYFLPSNINLEGFDIRQRFISWSIGGSYLNKKLPINIILDICSKISEPIVLLGGEEDIGMGDKIIEEVSKKNIYNYCGKLSLSESAYMIENSKLLLTNDSGMMHIGAACNKPIISFWGCTKPSLGFAPYQNKNKSILILSNDSNIPCSKHGDRCRNKSKLCINNISSTEILEAYNKLIT